MRDVNYGWLLRYVMQMELIIFYCSYAHIFRGMFYGSYLLHEKYYGARRNNISPHDNNAFLGHIYLGDK